MAGLQQRASHAVQRTFYKTFYAWGSFVGRRPILVILISTILAFAASARLLMSFGGDALPYENEQDKLWVPQTAQAVDDKSMYDAIFNSTVRRNTIYFTTQPLGGNVLTSSVLKEVRRFDAMVTANLNASEGTDGALEGGTVRYEDVCAQSLQRFGGADSAAPSCLIFGHPLELFYRVGGEFVLDWTDAEILAVVNSGKGIDERLYPADSNRTFNVEATFGGLEYDEAGTITGAKAILLTYSLAQFPEGDARRDAALAWEDQLNLLIGDQWTDEGLSIGSASAAQVVWSSPTVNIYPQTEGAISRELGSNIRGDIILINIGFMLIGGYALLVFFKFHPTRSRALLAISGIVSCVFSVGVAYGFSTLLGFEVNPVITVLPFILLGIGVDDMFVLVNELDATDPKKPPAERIALAMGHAGVAITITSVTDLFAFALGTTSQLPALATFCVFAAIGITADFLLQISFFAGWMALDAYREAKAKPDCCPCCVPSMPDHVATSCFCCAKNSCGLVAGPPEGRLRRALSNWYAPALSKKPVKVAVIVVAVAWAGISGWCASNLQQDFQFRWFVNDDAELQKVFDVQDNYYGQNSPPVNIITPGSAAFDYSTIDAQMKMNALGAAVEANVWIEAGSVTAWQSRFHEWVWQCGQTTELPAALGGGICVRRDCTYTVGASTLLVYPYCSLPKVLRDAGGTALLDGSGRELHGPGPNNKFMVDASGAPLPDGAPLAAAFVPPGSFYAWLDQFVADSPLGQLSASEVVWLDTSAVRDAAAVAEGVRATRLRAEFRTTDGASEQIASMETLRESVASVGVPGAFPYTFGFLFYEQFKIIQREALLNLVLALVAVFVIVLVIIAEIRTTLLVMLCVLLTDIDILGLMWLWGLTIDSVAIINLVLAVGLAVDYSAHVAHAFVAAKGTHDERMRAAITEMGTAVIHGAFSTFLAVLVLAFSSSYIFRVFFKQFFGICVFGVFHGLALLPVMLSLFGPPPTEGLSYEGKIEPRDDAKRHYKPNVQLSTVPAVGPVPSVESLPA